MGFILLTFTGISLTLIFHPLHMSVLYRCNRKKKKSKSKSHPLFWDFFHRKQGSNQWQASAVQKRKILCQNPWDSGNKHTATWNLSSGTQFIKRTYLFCTCVLGKKKNPIIMLLPTSAVDWFYPILWDIWKNKLLLHISIHSMIGVL